MKNSLHPELEVEWTNRPCIGEHVSGDAVHVSVKGSDYRVVLIDALGHGPDAAATANSLLKELDAIQYTDPGEMLTELHSRARETRGAAVSVVSVSSSTMKLKAATIGNTKVRILSGDKREEVSSSNGTVGLSIRTPKIYQCKLEVNQRVFLFSDGISSRFSDEIYSRLMYLSPKAATQMITRRFGKRFDDATAVMIAFAKT